MSQASLAAFATLDLSIVIPAHNEARRISPTIAEYLEYFRQSASHRFEIIVVINGSTDDTVAVVRSIAADASEVRIVDFPEPLGKGGAITEGLAIARGQILAFVDADNMVRAPEAAKLVRATTTADLAIGDRFNGIDEGGKSRSPLRRLVSGASRLWVRRFLGLELSDTQCGAKALNREAWELIGPRIRERGWAFDLDLLTQAHASELAVAEVPVRWRHVAQDSKVRPWRDVPTTLWATIGIKRRLAAYRSSSRSC